MLTRYAVSFTEVITRIEKLRQHAQIWKRGTHTGPVKVATFEAADFAATLTELRAECDKLAGEDPYGAPLLDLGSTIKVLSHIESELGIKGEDYTYPDMLGHLDTVGAVFAKDLEDISLARIATEKEKYFQKDDLFGSKVSDAFGSCSDEIRNAGTCYALELSDACVVHLMRVLERGLQAMAIKFNVSFKHEQWNGIIENLEKAIRQMDKSFGDDWKEQRTFYNAAAMQFMFFKEAWRNHVMHGRLLFNDGSARSVLDSVRGFMQAMAEGGLSE